ncbi:uncharacterized protein EV420DRAFT_736622 [Desarmillaria tabescens]|uniref:Uncharacterized protein n=1 Tax=Armillaria tabescens TaxID=1929756 RepID=A0AA39JX82_ARMTA|nr:uncharacterized protein EV420DRAFT_736622 [Desarmillaria tabescens]KAK0450464.1 hypothetical protein EV420DRAFT_736622 [Desarmillaria tabescens]
MTGNQDSSWMLCVSKGTSPTSDVMPSSSAEGSNVKSTPWCVGMISVIIHFPTACVHIDAIRITGTTTRQRDDQHMLTLFCHLRPSVLSSQAVVPSFIASTMDHRSAYHPNFSNPGADAVLSSLDGTLYRLPSSVLRRTTTFFASSSFTFGPDNESIPIHEHDDILERLLRIISGLAIPPWRTFDELEGVLSLL